MGRAVKAVLGTRYFRPSGTALPFPSAARDRPADSSRFQKRPWQHSQTRPHLSISTPPPARLIGRPMILCGCHDKQGVEENNPVALTSQLVRLRIPNISAVDALPSHPKAPAPPQTPDPAERTLFLPCPPVPLVSTRPKWVNRGTRTRCHPSAQRSRSLRRWRY